MKKTLSPMLFKFFSIAEPHLFSTDSPFSFKTVTYYKVKPGRLNEFVALWKKSAQPIYKELVAQGHLLSFKARSPLYQSTGSNRWDMKVELTYKTEEAAFDEVARTQAVNKVFRDADAYRRTQAHLAEVVLAQWAVKATNFILN
ncbi:hypothetical protein [Mucilaginibacter pedocola]|uniref:NIPSNAP domain-containing protein n=1 Tax=Mucilaginibacter pedocola TaxID=1792845 RepID=A0A1S9PCX2_9SPHI|nr:hypothetical protein [Mucilaginibacter pedocola]OOQ58771.1 hypothetical protein BC343_08955 [Mucilaginibacter pedocola]